MMKDIDEIGWVVAIPFIITIVIISGFFGWRQAMQQPAPTWNCIEPAEGIGWAMYCEVGDCNVLFIGDEWEMECE